MKHASNKIRAKLNTLHFIVLSNQENEELRNKIIVTFGSFVTFIDNNKTIDDYYLLNLRNAVFKQLKKGDKSLNEIGEEIKKKQQKV